jgi:MOSC domain-containing protein YiiM
MTGKVISINISDKKGVRKKPIPEAEFIADFGMKDDGHASSESHRQVSLLAVESIKKMQVKGLDVVPGDFAENITTEGIVLNTLPIGTMLEIGESIKGEISQIGKVCHTRCAIYHQAGDCVMPKEGIFVKVIKGGILKKGDSIKVL